MKALILVGGFGTRLRPLTFKKPKPLVEFANKPMMEYQIQALSLCGVKEIILAVGYQPDVMNDFSTEMKQKYGVEITCSHERQPLGTFGAVKFAESKLKGEEGQKSRFFVLNADIICNYPFQKMIDFMNTHDDCEGVIALTKVSDPSKYGVVLTEADTGKVTDFVEKPQEWVGDCINAGMYLFDSAILGRLDQVRKCSLEREIFPAMAEEDKLCAIDLENHWMDIGQPQDFIKGTALHLGFLKSQNDLSLSPIKENHILGNVVIHPTATVSPKAVLGPNVIIGKNCIIGEGVRLVDTTVLEGAIIKANTWMRKSIIGWQSVIGRWCRVEGVTVIAEDVIVKDELFINASFILPHKTLSVSLPQEGTIIM